MSDHSFEERGDGSLPPLCIKCGHDARSLNALNEGKHQKNTSCPPDLVDENKERV